MTARPNEMDERPLERWLEGVHAVVTGGGRGIGAAVAQALAQRGAALTIMGRDEMALARGAAALREGCGVRVEAVRCDVSSEREVERAFVLARQRLGDVGVLVNNAGIGEARALSQLSLDEWNRIVATNLTGTFLCSRAVIAGMLAARHGRIVNVASTAALRGYNRMSAYCASKHGVLGLTRALAVETAKHGITVNAVCPGYTETDMAQQAMDNIVAKLGKTPDEARAMLVAAVPRGTLTRPEEVAEAVVWLCSPGASAVTGVALPVAGGEGV
jgi:NAD(P)-dependent dehydrogenase (short-subunit alcohol dehydrogenase family)